MIIRRLIFVCILMSSTAALAQDTIQATYSYTYGDSESLVEARQTCKDLALRQAIESYSIFVESSTEVENFQLKDDLVTSIAAGNLKNVQILEQTEEGRTITMTVQAEVVAEEVESLVAELVASRDEDDEPDVAADDTEVQSFMTALSAYGKRSSTAEAAWGKKQYQSALSQFQDLESLLEKHQPTEDQPFYYNLYQAWKVRTTIVQNLIRIEYLESQNKRIRARANVTLAVRKTEEMGKYLAKLEGMQSLSDVQKRLLSACASRCRRTKEAVRKKAAGYGRR